MLGGRNNGFLIIRPGCKFLGMPQSPINPSWESLGSLFFNLLVYSRKRRDGFFHHSLTFSTSSQSQFTISHMQLQQILLLSLLALNQTTAFTTVFSTTRLSSSSFQIMASTTSNKEVLNICIISSKTIRYRRIQHLPISNKRTNTGSWNIPSRWYKRERTGSTLSFMGWKFLRY